MLARGGGQGRPRGEAFVVTLHPYCSCPLVSVERTEEGGAVVACGNCGMTGPESVDGDEDEAIRGWELLCRKMCTKCRVRLLERIGELKAEMNRRES